MTRKTDIDKDKVLFHMGRFFQHNTEWFYVTREGDERGPFESKDEAEADLAAYIRHRRNMEQYGQG